MSKEKQSIRETSGMLWVKSLASDYNCILQKPPWLL